MKRLESIPSFMTPMLQNKHPNQQLTGSGNVLQHQTRNWVKLKKWGPHRHSQNLYSDFKYYFITSKNSRQRHEDVRWGRHAQTPHQCQLFTMLHKHMSTQENNRKTKNSLCAGCFSEVFCFRSKSTQSSSHQMLFGIFIWSCSALVYSALFARTHSKWTRKGVRTEKTRDQDLHKLAAFKTARHIWARL